MIAVDQLSPDALIAHARRLVGDEDRGTDEHALDLRRAASGAYYAVYHDLCLRAAAQITGRDPANADPPTLVASHLVRWFTHSAVAEACHKVQALSAEVAQPGWRARRRAAWHLLHDSRAMPLPAHLLDITERIPRLRELRYDADYDRVRVLDFDTVAAAVRHAANVVGLVRQHADSPAYRGFLVLVAMSARRQLQD